MSDETIEISVERANLVHNLLVAAQQWRANLIPGTGTATWNSVVDLVKATAAFDPPERVCKHDRSWRVYYPNSAGGGEVCGYCGTSVGPSETLSG